MKFNKLFFKFFIPFFFILFLFSCNAGIENSGLYEIQYHDIKNKSSDIATYFDGIVYFKDESSLYKIFPKSFLKFKNNKYELSEGKILKVNKNIFLSGKISSIDLEEKLFFINQQGNTQFFKIKIPYYFYKLNSKVILIYYKDDEKLAEVETKLLFINKNNFNDYYGFFIPLNYHTWNVNKVILKIDISSENKYEVKLIKKIDINPFAFKEDIVYLDYAKSKEYFAYDTKKIQEEVKKKFEIWTENNRLLYLFSGYDYPVRDEFYYSSLFGESRVFKDFKGKKIIDSTHHTGLDIPKPKDENVYAACDGIVRLARLNELFGNTVIVEHGFSFFTTYYHLDKILVKEGMIIKKGDIIGIIGNTGNSTGAHLHWEARIYGLPVDPRSFFGIEDIIKP